MFPIDYRAAYVLFVAFSTSKRVHEHCMLQTAYPLFAAPDRLGPAEPCKLLCRLQLAFVRVKQCLSAEDMQTYNMQLLCADQPP